MARGHRAIAGCALYGLPTRVIGVSADDTAIDVAATVGGIIAGIGELLSANAEAAATAFRPMDHERRNA